jgi:hypothetical protein
VQGKSSKKGESINIIKKGKEIREHIRARRERIENLCLEFREGNPVTP